jgi:hypothetical protein
MAKALIDSTDQVQLLRYLLVVELHRAGLKQTEIRARLGLSMNVVNAMLKGVHRTLTNNGVQSE